MNPEDVVFDIADRLRKARELAGYDQSQMADLIDVSRATVSNYEHRHTRPMINNVKMWALATGLPFEWIWTGRWPGTNPRDTGQYHAHLRLA